RSVESRIPPVTVWRTGSLAPATDTGSVNAAAARLTELSGPIISTVLGSAITFPTANPGSGFPSTAGNTGTCLFADFSNTKATDEGVIWTISRPKGTRI